MTRPKWTSKIIVCDQLEPVIKKTPTNTNWRLGNIKTVMNRLIHLRFNPAIVQLRMPLVISTV